MVREGRRRNPFRPGAGQMPPYLAGREAELALAEDRLDELRGGTAPARGILFYGPRGNGKTVLLERIAARARDLELRAERLPPDALRDEGRLVRFLRERARLTGGRLTGVQPGPLGATAERAEQAAECARWRPSPPPPTAGRTVPQGRGWDRRVSGRWGSRASPITSSAAPPAPDARRKASRESSGSASRQASRESCRRGRTGRGPRSAARRRRVPGPAGRCRGTG